MSGQHVQRQWKERSTVQEETINKTLDVYKTDLNMNTLFPQSAIDHAPLNQGYNPPSSPKSVRIALH